MCLSVGSTWQFCGYLNKRNGRVLVYVLSLFHLPPPSPRVLCCEVSGVCLGDSGSKGPGTYYSYLSGFTPVTSPLRSQCLSSARSWLISHTFPIIPLPRRWVRTLSHLNPLLLPLLPPHLPDASGPYSHQPLPAHPTLREQPSPLLP